MNIPILLCFDNKFAPHAATVMESIVRNALQKVAFIVMYYEGDLDEKVRKILQNHFEERATLEFAEVKTEMKAKISCEFAEVLSLNAFLRLFAADILTDKEEIIYLDSDLVVLGDIVELMNSVDRQYVINAVAQYEPSGDMEAFIEKTHKSKKEIMAMSSIKDITQPSLEHCEIPLICPYFNSGVLYINLALWRTENMTQKVSAFMRTHSILTYADQDVLNGVLKGQWALLPPAWNTTSMVKALDCYSNKYTMQQLQECYDAPKIIHYAGVKPWSYLYRNFEPWAPNKRALDKHAQQLYWYYRSFTPWPEKELADKTIKNMICYTLFNIIKDVLQYAIGYNLYTKLTNIIKK